jgi:hypothetical protein
MNSFYELAGKYTLAFLYLAFRILMKSNNSKLNPNSGFTVGDSVPSWFDVTKHQYDK